MRVGTSRALNHASTMGIAVAMVCFLFATGPAFARGAWVVNSKFIEAQNAYQRLPPAAIDSELASTWSGLVARQHDLMSTACNQIDPTCDQADAAVRDYNAQCHGTVSPDVYQSCISQKPAVDSAVNACRAVVGPYSAAVNSWVADLNSFVSAIQAKAIANCSKRAGLVSQWNNDKESVSVDQQVIGNLNRAIRQHVSDLETVGVNLTEFHDYLDKFGEAVESLESHGIAKDLADVSEEKLL